MLKSVVLMSLRLLWTSKMQKWKQIKTAWDIFLDKLDKNPYKIWRFRCCRLHRLACLNTSARRYIAWRQNSNICLTVVIIWICLGFRNIGIRYFRKMGICIPKYTAEQWEYSALQCWELCSFLGLVLSWN